MSSILFKTIFSLGLLGCTLPLSAEIRTVLATGVNPSDKSSYTNIQQGRLPTCWAASGSNVVGHWQSYHAPQSDAPKSAQDVYNTYLSIYSGYREGESDSLYRWWLGHYSAAALGGYYPTEAFWTAGGYYKDIYTESEVADLAWQYTNAFRVWESDTFYTTYLSRAIYYALENGHAMSVNIPNRRHAITIYGATFDTETNLLTSVWVCDSSGACFDKDAMSHIQVGVRKNSWGAERLCLTAYYGASTEFVDYYGKMYIEDVYFLGNSETKTKNFVFAIPEPSAFGLLAGLGTLALVASGRGRERVEIKD